MYNGDMMSPRRGGDTSGCGCDGSTEKVYGYEPAPPCIHHSWGLESYPNAIVFAPLQSFENLYDLDTGMKNGTIFIDLDLPFTRGAHTKGGCCHDGV